MKINIPNSEIQELLAGEVYAYPKYSTQILNLANQNSQGTRASIVGQMSDLIQQFEGKELEEWRKWYLEGHPDAIEKATERVWGMINLLKISIESIDKDLVKRWVEDLVVVKTFAGLKFQNAILKKIASTLGKEYRLAEPIEESKGIDGFIGDKPASIKPTSYKLMMGLNEVIGVPLVYYEKRKSDIQIEFNPEDF